MTDAGCPKSTESDYARTIQIIVQLCRTWLQAVLLAKSKIDLESEAVMVRHIARLPPCRDQRPLEPRFRRNSTML